MANITVVGAGYVGLVTAVCLAELGHTVVTVEIDPVRLDALERGVIPIYEPGLTEMAARNRSAGRLSFTNDYGQAIPLSNFAFIAVNTPALSDGQADTRFVHTATRSILRHAHPHLILVVKSTVPVGTGDALRQQAAQKGWSDLEVVSNPEFLREGSAIGDFLRPDRIVVGADGALASAAVAHLYAALGAPIITCGRRAAELAKYTANAFLATRISFMNEISAVCDAVDADIEEVARAVGADQRIGPAFLRAGLGWGGSCFPKDVRALAATAASHHCPTPILDAVGHMNAIQRGRAIDCLRSAIEGVENPTVGILGLAFKPDTDDIRESPALAISAQLHQSGIRVRVHDPVAMDNARRDVPELEYCQNPYEVALGSHALLLATEWRDYLDLNWRRMRLLMPGKMVFDGRNVLDARSLSELGFTYLSFGRSATRVSPDLRDNDLRVESAS